MMYYGKIPAVSTNSSSTARTAVHSSGFPTVSACWTRHAFFTCWDASCPKSASAIFTTNQAVTTMDKSACPGAPSAQALSMPYVQPNRPLTSSQTQQTAPPLSNHMHGVGTSGIPISAPYAVRTHQQISTLCLLTCFMGCLLDSLLKFCIVLVCTILFWPDTK